MSKGRVYRRCPCKDADGRELGPRCPLLDADPKHGKWGFAVDMPSADNKRKTMRRHQWTMKSAATRARDEVLARYGAGVKVDDRENTANRLRSWLREKSRTLKPKTLHRYTEIVTKELIPVLGALPFGAAEPRSCGCVHRRT